jgi:hypothetical protein
VTLPGSGPACSRGFGRRDSSVARGSCRRQRSRPRRRGDTPRRKPGLGRRLQIASAETLSACFRPRVEPAPSIERITFFTETRDGVAHEGHHLVDPDDVIRAEGPKRQSGYCARGSERPGLRSAGLESGWLPPTCRRTTQRRNLNRVEHRRLQLTIREGGCDHQLARAGGGGSR